jgi:hypothetical protein
MDFFEYVPLFFVAIGLLIVGGGIRQILRARAFAARAQRVPGTVTDVRTRLSGSGEHLRARQRPVLTFTTLDGQEITTEARESSDRGVGNGVGVLYNPSNPTEAQIDEGRPTWAGLGMVIIGLVFAGFAFGMFTAVNDGSDPFTSDDHGASVECADTNDQPIACPAGLDDQP